MIGLLDWVAYNIVVSPPRPDVFPEHFSIVIYYLKLFIVTYAALAPVALLVFTVKWLRERKRYDHSRISN